VLAILPSRADNLFHSNGSLQQNSALPLSDPPTLNFNSANLRGGSRVTFLDPTASYVTAPSAKLEPYCYSQVSNTQKQGQLQREKKEKRNVGVTANGWSTPGPRQPQLAGCPKTGPGRRSAACPSASSGACCSCPPTRWPRARVRTPSGTAGGVESFSQAREEVRRR
jgi:hypothetical protein